MKKIIFEKLTIRETRNILGRGPGDPLNDDSSDPVACAPDDPPTPGHDNYDSSCPTIEPTGPDSPCSNDG